MTSRNTSTRAAAATGDRAPHFAPDRLACWIGGHFGSSFSIALDGDELVHEESEQGVPVSTKRTTPTDDQWRRFDTALEKAGAWTWAGDYSPPYLVMDGTSWSITILRDGRLLQAHGSNGYPPIGEGDTEGPFGRFCTALERLAGGQFR